jgi:hypothetical protein
VSWGGKVTESFHLTGSGNQKACRPQRKPGNLEVHDTARDDVAVVKGLPWKTGDGWVAVPSWTATSLRLGPAG